MMEGSLSEISPTLGKINETDLDRLGPDEKLRLLLPGDVKTEPSKDDLKRLFRRMKSYSKLLAKWEGKKRTDSEPIPEEYGDKSSLIAVLPGSFEMKYIEGVKTSDRMPSTEEMVREWGSPVGVPPVFLEVAEMYRGEVLADWVRVRDGNHRVAAIKESNLPFFLAYMRNNELDRARALGLNFRKVESQY